MSRLIYKGNTINNFGRFLPAPYIDRIIVYDEYIEATVNLFIDIPEEYVDNDDYIDRLGLDGLAYYVFLLTNADITEEIINKESNVFYYMNYAVEDATLIPPTGYLAPAVAGEFIQLTFSDFIDSEEILYSAAGTKIRKFQAIVQLTEATEVLPTTAWEDTYDGGVLLSLSSTLKYDELDSSLLEEFLSNPPLIDNNISDISYETIFENGSIASATQVVWLDSEKEPYDGYILQSFTSQYHKSENITHEDIINSIQEILDDYEDLVQTQPDLQSVINDISYVLSVYALEPELLPHLNLLRKTFPSKSTATTIGQLYVRFRGKIFEANQVVSQEDRLFKQLIINPKIIDSRDPTETDWELNEVATYDDDELLYDHWYITSQTAVSNESEGAWEPDKIVTNGFFFFDYEKLKDICLASQIFDRSLLEDYFGSSILQSALNIATAEIRRAKWGRSSSSEDIAENEVSTTMLATIDSNPKTSDVLHRAMSLDTYGNYSFTDENDLELFSYLMLRSFNLTSPDGLGGYALMCFEFQDIYNYDEISNLDNPNWEITYEASVEVEDNTSIVIKGIINDYFKRMNNFENYWDIANEICSYNDLDGKFNSFFVETLKDKYSSPPWTSMPIVFNVHKDLLNNKFDGDRDALIESSKAITAKISPYTGTLGELEAFWIQVQTLYDDNYAGFNYKYSGEDDPDGEYEPNNPIPLALYEHDSEANSTTYDVSADRLPAVYEDSWVCGDDNDCEDRYGSEYYKCRSTHGACYEVECLTDDDCNGGKCRTSRGFTGCVDVAPETIEECTPIDDGYTYFDWEESGDLWDGYVERIEACEGVDRDDLGDIVMAAGQKWIGAYYEWLEEAKLHSDYDDWAPDTGREHLYHILIRCGTNWNTVYEYINDTLGNIDGWVEIASMLDQAEAEPAWSGNGPRLSDDGENALREFAQYIYPNFDRSNSNVDDEDIGFYRGTIGDALNFNPEQEDLGDGVFDIEGSVDQYYALFSTS